jgi:hypothetical protein
LKLPVQAVHDFTQLFGLQEIRGAAAEVELDDLAILIEQRAGE